VHELSYKTSDIKTKVLRLTGGKGADFVSNNVGITFALDDLDVVREDGSIASVGFLEGLVADHCPNILLSLIMKTAISSKWQKKTPA
jgi:NADPH:quinone reductase-like Zn-dependent oxidoreductase